MTTILGILGVLGICGGIICAIADFIFDFTGPDNTKLGKNGIINSNWVNMAPWRFPLSISIAAIGVPLYYCSFVALWIHISIVDEFTGNIFLALATIGTFGGLFIHATLCIFPTIYKKLSEKGQEALAIEAIEQVMKGIKVPFFAYYVLLVVCPSVILMYLILSSVIAAPWYFALLNPLAFVAIRLLLQPLFNKKNWEVPGFGSLGLAALGLLVLLLPMVLA